MIIRAVSKKDLDAVETCAKGSSVGIVNLPKDRNLLKRHIEDSVHAFSKDVKAPDDEDYLFVLSDGSQVFGTCGIYAKIGTKHPFYVFQIDQLPQSSLPSPDEMRLLVPKKFPEENSEICALYLVPSMRKEGYGRLLSLSRFLFMATNPHRFCKTTIANMRGFIENGRSAFWEAVGKPLLPMTFDKVMGMRTASDDFIGTLFKYPIYAALLPPEAQKVIGETHPNTQPAIRILLEQGFIQTKNIDPIDGGPILQAKTQDIHTIGHSIVCNIKAITKTVIASDRYIVSNNRLDFRSCYSTLMLDSNGEAAISEDTAKALEVSPGDKIRYIA